MNPVLKLFLITTLVQQATCTIGGLTYMDNLNLAPSSRFPIPGEDPCKPLYWYPRQVPEYCNRPLPLPALPPPRPAVPAPPPPPPPPQPIPFPLMPMPMPIPLPVPINPPMLMPVPPYPSPFPAPMLPAPAYPYPPPPPMSAGMVPGIDGMVSPDGGINVLPFSDAYSDLLEKHKQKIIRIRLQKILDEYERSPRRYGRRKYRRKRIYYTDESDE